ncbi:hypothetical protein D5018_03960 [Parashewanella curva]|uniref:Major tail protein n=1 Tax=Parashewanella curva TaxID=2338552 RepID=A0A3L8Q0B7_9GAMM|nr:hypothetical protein [Parashewanella curva]RLV61005.1 hypothetical protein D5018_03960 [Parashewanella curva]
MSETVTESYIGNGIVYVDGRDVGNASSVNIEIEQETKAQPNYRGGGGNVAEVTKVNSVKLSMTLSDFSNENLALALRGKVETLTQDTVTDEVITTKHGILVETAKMIDIAQTVTVKPESGSTTPFVENTDYVLSSAGIRVLSTGGIADGAKVKVSYKSVAGSALQALSESGKEVRVVIDGINDATGKRWTLKLFKWKPSPTSGLDLIGDDFGAFDVEGGVLADQSIVAAGKSKFFVRSAAQ